MNFICLSVLQKVCTNTAQRHFIIAKETEPPVGSPNDQTDTPLLEVRGCPFPPSCANTHRGCSYRLASLCPLRIYRKPPTAVMTKGKLNCILTALQILVDFSFRPLCDFSSRRSFETSGEIGSTAGNARLRSSPLWVSPGAYAVEGSSLEPAN